MSERDDAGGAEDDDDPPFDVVQAVSDFVERVIEEVDAHPGDGPLDDPPDAGDG